MMTSVLMSEGFEVKLVNKKLGQLKAQSVPDYSSWTGHGILNRWSFTIHSDLSVQACAISYRASKDLSGLLALETRGRIDDRAHEDQTWYWSVRNKLQELCGSQITFIEGGSTPFQP